MLQLPYLSCLFSTDSQGGRGQWTAEGIETRVIDEDGDDLTDVVMCLASHLTNFGVLAVGMMLKVR